MKSAAVIVADVEWAPWPAGERFPCEISELSEQERAGLLTAAVKPDGSRRVHGWSASAQKLFEMVERDGIVQVYEAHPAPVIHRYKPSDAAQQAAQARLAEQRARVRPATRAKQ